MRLNRRNVLIGLGTVAVGSGAALGSGAFTQVSAERTMAVDVTGDANAFLGLNAVASSGAVVDTGGTDGNELEVDLSASFASGDGVNDNATTTIGLVDDVNSPGAINAAAFTITNNGNVPVDVSIQNVAGNNTGILSLPTFVATANHDTTNNDFSNVLDLRSVTLEGLAAGQSAEVVVLIDTTGSVTPGTDAVTGVTIQATTS